MSATISMYVLIAIFECYAGRGVATSKIEGYPTYESCAAVVQDLRKKNLGDFEMVTGVCLQGPEQQK